MAFIIHVLIKTLKVFTDLGVGEGGWLYKEHTITQKLMEKTWCDGRFLALNNKRAGNRKDKLPCAHSTTLLPGTGPTEVWSFTKSCSQGMQCNISDEKQHFCIGWRGLPFPDAGQTCTLTKINTSSINEPPWPPDQCGEIQTNSSQPRMLSVQMPPYQALLGRL